MLVSIVIPVFNAEKFLQRCVDALLCQSHAQLDIILVNDGSSDSSGAICDQYAIADSRVSVLHQNNSGPSVARNKGIELARGEYLMFVDADDFVEHNLVETLIGEFESGSVGLAVCTYRSRLFSNGVEIAANTFELETKRFTVDEFLSTATLDISDPISVRARAHITGNIWGRLYDRSIVNAHRLRFNVALNRYEDILFNVSYLACISDILVVNAPLYNYTVNSGHVSLSDQVTKTKFHMLAASYVEICDRLSKKRIDYIQYFYSYILMGYLIRLFQKGSPFSFLEAYRELRVVCHSEIYRGAMEHYKTPPGASVLIPRLLKLKLYLFASIAAKARMLKAAMANKPVRQWCFAPAAK